MSFLQPWLLLALPLVLIPIIIHLVNQWRYQTKQWAAMMFLMSAKSMHRGLAKLRQWLILAMRVLAIAGLILAISRPLTTGIMSLIAGGRIDTTIVMLDRSPSMLQQGIASRESKLMTALRQLRETLTTQPSSRWILIDSAKPVPQEFASLSALVDSPVSAGTSAIANWPVMFQSALDYLQKNRPSQTHIWICSDMRQGDWKSQQGPWSAIREAFQKLPNQVRFFAFSYPAISSTNRSISIDRVSLDSEEDRHEVVLTIRVHRDASPAVKETVPVQLAIGSGRSEIPIELVNGAGELKDFRVPIDASVSLGWGKASIPADDNAGDNEQYFAFDVAPARETMIFCEQPDLVLPIQIASEISRNAKVASSVSVSTMDQVEDASLEAASLVIWQGPLPEGELTDRLEAHLDRGRTLWFLPPIAMLEQGSGIDSDRTFIDFRWSTWHQPTSPIKPTTWRTDEGLLESTQSGMALPVGEITVLGFAKFDGDATPLATLEGGAPLLAKLNTTRGSAYVCTTLPIERTSTMATNGIALFIAIQRSIEQGIAMLGNAVQYEAVPLVNDSASDASMAVDKTSNNRFNLTPLETWQGVATDERFLSSEMGLHSGVFESGAKLVAVNRPVAEDIAESMSRDQFSQLLKGLDVVNIEDTAGSTKKIQQEIWRVFLILMIAALLLEALFSLPRKQAA